MMKKNTMQLLVLGDQAVGKTSLICAIMSEVQTELVKTLKKVVLPPDMCLYSKDIFTEIIDTSSQTDLEPQINTCDLIMLVYDVSLLDSMFRLENYWLPIISEINRERQTPIILVGNKLDKVELEISQETEYTPVKDVLRNLMKKYKQLQMGIECSAYYNRNIQKVLNSAQRAVLYPFRPLYDLNSKQITPKFKKALIRIFRILDKDLTGKLSDNELSKLQERVFQAELSFEDIKAIKAIIQKEEQEDPNNFIQVGGFIAFQKKCIEMLKIQICWSILKYFNYDHELEIESNNEEFIIDYEAGESLELSNLATSLLQRMYWFGCKFAKEGESAMEKVFECSPSIPLEEFNQKDLSLEKFLLTWSMYALLDYLGCYRSLLYLGFELSLDSCFTKTTPKTTYSHLLQLKQRNFYTILILENQLLAPYLNQIFSDAVQHHNLKRKTVLFSQPNQSKILLLFQIKRKHFKQFLEESDLRKKIDLIVYFDYLEEFEHKDFLGKICQHAMIRKISKDEEKEIKIFEESSLNLNSFPVEFNKANFNKFYQWLLTTFTEIKLGYSKEKIQRLKSQDERFEKIIMGVAGAIGTIALALYFFSKKAGLK